AAVVAIAALRPLKGTVLEENIARTTASVGEALVAGAIFTIPAFVLSGVWDHIHYRDATLIMLIGGRVIPSFTRNWLVRENPGRLPAAFSRFDVLSIAVAVAALALWTLRPEAEMTAAVMALAALLQFIRLGRWAGDRTLRDPLVWILHAGYLFVPIGFALIGAAIVLPELVSPLAGVHALGVGAVGGMTLAMMVRASLGHTGQALRVRPAVTFIFMAVLIAAVARILAAMTDSHSGLVLHVAAFAWMAAFCGFAVVFAPALMRRRKAG
ncbi:MAG: NnrS family protein, partial [Hoeflea sp.]|nr:NnrS family protein [Hoeflea sp.]